MGLKFPMDLEVWTAWQRSQHRLRQIVRSRSASQAPSRLTLTIPAEEEPRLLVALDVAEGLKAERLLRPVRGIPVAILSESRTQDISESSARLSHSVFAEDLESYLPRVNTVLSHGHYESAGFAAYRFAERNGHQQVVIQHGLLTPYQPPLPPDVHLLAWSDADAEFWKSGRRDISSTVVGSQLLALAAAEPAQNVDATAAPTFLGQLHGAELPRRGMARAAGSFCRENGATYRPHPSEVDRLSRAQHALWERRGIVVDRSGSPLREHDGPVVAAFSTGILEAASRNVPAYVYYPGAPDWLREFWQRYQMAPWGASEPTPAPDTGDDPVAAVRDAVLARIERTSG